MPILADAHNKLGNLNALPLAEPERGDSLVPRPHAQKQRIRYTTQPYTHSYTHAHIRTIIHGSRPAGWQSLGRLAAGRPTGKQLAAGPPPTSWPVVTASSLAAGWLPPGRPTMQIYGTTLFFNRKTLFNSFILDCPQQIAYENIAKRL